MNNNNLRVLIIDDEKNAISALSVTIEEYASDVEIIGTALSAKDGLRLMRELDEIDVVFIDIQMPHMSGIQLIETVGEDRKFEVVFLTAFNNYAHEAFKLNAFYYLLKPINVSDFVSLIKKLKEKLKASNREFHHNKLKEAFRNKISIPSSTGIEFITISDIIRIEADGSYVNIHLVNKPPLVFAKNLKAIEELLLNDTFFRTHKSHLINIQFVVKYVSQKDGGTITMVDKSEIELSRTHKEEFMKLYKS